MALLANLTGPNRKFNNANVLPRLSGHEFISDTNKYLVYSYD